MKQRDLIYLSIILLIITAAFFMGQRQGKTIEALRNQNEFLEQQIRDMESQRDSALSRANKEETQRAIIVKTALTEQATLKAEIHRLRNRRVQISTTSVRIDSSMVKIDSAALLVNCDSLLERQDALIFSLEGEKIATTASFERQLSDMQDALKAERAISETWRESAQDNSKRLRKETRRKRFWRSVGVVATVGLLGILIGTQ